MTSGKEAMLTLEFLVGKRFLEPGEPVCVTIPEKTCCCQLCSVVIWKLQQAQCALVTPDGMVEGNEPSDANTIFAYWSRASTQ